MEILCFILIGISCLAILITLIVLILNILGKLKSKTDSNGKKSFFWIFPFILLICLSFGLIVGVLLTKVDMIEENMDDIINDTNSVIESARQKLAEVPLQYFRIVSKFIIPKELKAFLDNSRNISGFANIRDSNYSHLVKAAVNSLILKDFTNWVEELVNSYPTECGAKTDVHKDDIIQRLANLRTENENVQSNIDKSASQFTNFFETSLHQLDEQENMDFGGKKVLNDLDTMKKILDHFETNVNDTEKTREKYLQKMVELAPDKQLIVKVIVAVTCVILILLSILIIIAIVRPKIIVQKRVLYLIYATGLLTIVTSLTAIGVAVGFIGFFDCPLANGNLGLADFTSPVPGTTNFTICASSDPTLFATFDNDRSITTDTIAQSIKIDEFKSKLMTTFFGSMGLFKLKQEWITNLDKVKESFKKIDELFDKKCLDDKKQNELSEIHNILREVVDECVRLKSLIDKFNDYVRNSEQYIKPGFDLMYTNAINEINKTISDTRQNIMASDFSCNPIITSYSTIGDSICAQLEIPFGPYWICFILTILASMVSLTLQTVANRYLESVKPDNEQSKSNTQTPTAMSN